MIVDLKLVAESCATQQQKKAFQIMATYYELIVSKKGEAAKLVSYLSGAQAPAPKKKTSVSANYISSDGLGEVGKCATCGENKLKNPIPQETLDSATNYARIAPPPPAPPTEPDGYDLKLFIEFAEANESVTLAVMKKELKAHGVEFTPDAWKSGKQEFINYLKRTKLGVNI